jgi:predicted dehydrogenase
MIKVGIIGYGKMGQIRYNSIVNRPDINIVAISEPNKDIVVPTNLRVETAEEIIKRSDVDAIFICTPNSFNKTYTIQSLDENKNVFCEKPPAFTAKDVSEIIDHETKSNKKLMYGFNHRHHDSIIHMKSLIDSGTFGKVLWMRGRYGKSVNKEFYDNWRAKKAMSGGGIFIDQGIHMLDLFMHLTGEFDVVKSLVSNLYWKLDVEDNVFAIFENTKSGVTASLHSTMTQWRHLFSLEVFLEKGHITLNGLVTPSGAYGSEELSIAENRTIAPAATLSKRELITYKVDNSWSSEADHFINAIKNDTAINIGNSFDALRLMRMIDKVYDKGEVDG